MNIVYNAQAVAACVPYQSLYISNVPRSGNIFSTSKAIYKKILALAGASASSMKMIINSTSNNYYSIFLWIYDQGTYDRIKNKSIYVQRNRLVLEEVLNRKVYIVDELGEDTEVMQKINSAVRALGCKNYRAEVRILGLDAVPVAFPSSECGRVSVTYKKLITLKFPQSTSLPAVRHSLAGAVPGTHFYSSMPLGGCADVPYKILIKGVSLQNEKAILPLLYNSQYIYSFNLYSNEGYDESGIKLRYVVEFMDKGYLDRIVSFVQFLRISNPHLALHFIR